MMPKTTQAAPDSQRTAAHRVDWLLAKRADFRRHDVNNQDSRIHPGYYTPVMVIEGGKRVVKPMRYQGRAATQSWTTVSGPAWSIAWPPEG